MYFMYLCLSNNGALFLLLRLRVLNAELDARIYSFRLASAWMDIVRTRLILACLSKLVMHRISLVSNILDHFLYL